MLPMYQDLLSSTPDRVAENTHSYVTLTEHHVQAMWWEQKYFRNIFSDDGEPIEILSPGIWNAESGPDFLKAHLRIGSRELRGDIEIHLHQEGWFQHHHHVDERYNQVILHVCFWKPKRKKPVQRKDGIEIISASLEHFLTIPPSRIIQLIDLDLYPYKAFSGTGQCSQQIFRRLPEEILKKFFSSASYWRLQQKKNFLQHRFSTPSQQLIGGLSMALGYKRNAQPFLELYQFLAGIKCNSEELLPIALGCSGFFGEGVPPHWNESSCYLNLKAIWNRIEGAILFRCPIQVDHVRPFNHPVRRLAYLTMLLQDPGHELLSSLIKKTWKDHFQKILTSTKHCSSLRESLLDSIPNYQHSYWNHHYTFEKTPQSSFLSLIGQDLKTEILINTILPLLYSEIIEAGDPAEWLTFETFYQSLPGSQTGKRDYLKYRLFGDSTKGKLLNRSQMQQGAYQLHKDFCLHYEASCEGCPFVERFQSSSFGDAKH